MKFEKAIFTTRLKDIGRGIDRVYYGNEFCENLIPTLDSLKRCYYYTKSKDKGFTFVTPFTTNSGLKRLERLLGFLDKEETTETVFNDWGVFKLTKDNFKNIRPVLGRLLTKQRRDPRILKILLGNQEVKKRIGSSKKKKTILFPRKVPKTLFTHYQASVINVDIFQEYLLSQGINRLEIDNLIWKMDINVNKKIGVSIYLPYGYITTTRMCGKMTLTYSACGKECKRYLFKLQGDAVPVPFYAAGNTLFYKSNSVSNDYLEKLGIDRVVYQPRPPF